MNQYEVETRVVYFPPTRPTQFKQAKDIDAARAIAEEHADDAPIIEQRTVTYTEWKTVANWTQTAGDVAS